MDESEPDSQIMQMDETPSTESICVDSECLLEHHECTNEECLRRRRHFKVKQNQNKQDEIDTSSEEPTNNNCFGSFDPNLYCDSYEVYKIIIKT